MEFIIVIMKYSLVCYSEVSHWIGFVIFNKHVLLVEIYFFPLILISTVVTVTVMLIVTKSH